MPSDQLPHSCWPEIREGITRRGRRNWSSGYAPTKKAKCLRAQDAEPQWMLALQEEEGKVR